MKKRKCYIVIPNWNGIEFLGDCLASIQTPVESVGLIVVDNGSTDGSIVLVKDRFPEVNLITLDRNYGFVGGVNRGIERAIEQGCEYVALLNNDAVAEPDWLEKLVARMDDSPKVAIASRWRETR